MLNRAFRGLKSEGVTVGDDDTVEAINRTIQQANTILEGYHAEFTLPDFLDVQNRMNCPYEAYVLSYIDEPEPDGSANYGVDLIDVQEKDSGYSLRVASCRDEKQHGYLREDWQDWCERMVRLYGCRITTTEERVPVDGGNLAGRDRPLEESVGKRSRRPSALNQIKKNLQTQKKYLSLQSQTMVL